MPRTGRSRLSRRRLTEAGAGKDRWIHDVDWSSRGVGEDLVEDIGELLFVLVACDVSDVRHADDVLEPEQRVPFVEDRLLLVDVDGGPARAPGLERGYQCTGIDKPSATGIDQERSRLHATQV